MGKTLHADLRTLINSDVCVNQHIAENGQLQNKWTGGKLGHIYSVADINFSGEYFICLTGTQAESPVWSTYFSHLKRQKGGGGMKGRLKILLAAQENLQNSFCVIISDFSVDAGSWWEEEVRAFGSRLLSDLSRTFHKRNEKESSLFINQPRGKKS